MQWRTRAARPRRPAVEPINAEVKATVLAEMAAEIERSPVLSSFGIQVRFLRGRFYIERPLPTGVLVCGRITPLANELLLEVEFGSWSEVTRGSAQEVIAVMANDRKGTFHGLGSVDESLRKADQGLTRQPMSVKEGKYVYTNTGEFCGTVQEVLFHFFGLPLDVIAEPRIWYAYHRTPTIVSRTPDLTRVLLRFSASSWTGQGFGGTCLYVNRNGVWGAYRIRPSESDTIASAEAWLIKRKWKPWE